MFISILHKYAICNYTIHTIGGAIILSPCATVPPGLLLIYYTK